jgi:hypothetical protein
MDKKYRVYADLTPATRQQLFEAVRDKAVKCTDRTHLCAAIYPWILHLVHEYADKQNTRLAVDSFRMELYDFHRAMSAYPSAIPCIVSPNSHPLDIKRIRSEALEDAIEMAVSIANLEVCQIDINLSAIMARFVEDL